MFVDGFIVLFCVFLVPSGHGIPTCLPVMKPKPEQIVETVSGELDRLHVGENC